MLLPMQVMVMQLIHNIMAVHGVTLHLRVSFTPEKFYRFHFYSPETLSLSSPFPKRNELPYLAVYCHPK